MKKFIIPCLIACALFFTSCDSLLGPLYAENDDILIHVFDATAEEAFGSSALGQLAITFGGLNNISKSHKINSVEMLEWNLDESVSGYSYTGYFITYKIDLEDLGTWYTLVELTEFDDERYEWEVIASHRSLSAIQSLLY